MEVILTAYLGFEGLSIWKLTPLIGREAIFSQIGFADNPIDEDIRRYAEKLGEEAKKGHVPTSKDVNTLKRMTKQASWKKVWRSVRRFSWEKCYKAYSFFHLAASFTNRYSPVLLPIVVILSLFDTPEAISAVTLIVLIVFIVKSIVMGCYLTFNKIVLSISMTTSPNAQNVVGYDVTQNPKTTDKDTSK